MSERKIILKMAEASDRSAVGGKFANQQKMTSIGMPIPKFFCLSVSFYERVWRELGPKVESMIETCDTTQTHWAKSLSQAIRALFHAHTISEELKALILQQFDANFAKDTFVSVRGSMVGRTEAESEDSADNPFAGMSDSFLYVVRDQIIDKVSHCWSSGFSEEAIVYRHAQGMSLTGFGTAVGVQEMVSGASSFVLFTCDPKVATRDTIIVAGYGVGEGVVQERVPTDHYFLNHLTQVITSHTANKDEKLVLDRSQGFGLRSEPVESSLAGKPCLNEEQIRTLAGMGRKIEELFGAPQDIEGCVLADGTIYILQARPIALDFRRMRVWSNANVTESFPGPTTALTYSFAKYFYGVIFYDCYRMLGIPVRTLHDNRESLDKMIGFVQNRVYYCLSAFYHLHSLSPLFPIFKGSWENMMGFRSSYITKEKSILEKISDTIRLVLAVTHSLSVTIWRYLRHDADQKKFFVWWEGLMGPLRAKKFDTTDPMVSLFEFQRVWREVGNNWGVTLTNDTWLPMYQGLTQSLFKKWGLDADPSLLSDLLCGDDQLVSVEIILSAVRLSEQVRSTPALLLIFKAKTPEEITESIKARKIDMDFVRAFETHMHRFGDRGLQELKLEQLSMRETPETLVRMIQGYATSDVTVASFKDRETELRQAAEIRLSEVLSRSPFKKMFLRFLLGRLRWLIRNRENSRYSRSELYGFSRAIFKGIAVQFVKAGHLDKGDDIFHLSQEEIFGFIDGTGVTRNLKGLVAIRRAEYEESKTFETPIDLTTLGTFQGNNLIAQESIKIDEGQMKGLGSSPGKVRGRAKVVVDPNAPIVNTGDIILIARETDPGWLFLMLSSKGIVVERGSMLSHTAITGRKFGIPTIVSLPNATQLIPDGAWIEIDGGSGVVTILKEES